MTFRKRLLACLLAGLLLLSAVPFSIVAEEVTPPTEEIPENPPVDTGIPTYELMRFSNFERDYSRETNNLLYGDTLYADWTRADGLTSETGIDLETNYPGRENLRLKISFQLSSTNPLVNVNDCWEGFTVKLRSPDVENKEGDPNLKENGGNDDYNREHNYGWNVRPADVKCIDGRFDISIPLNRPCDNSRGLMDWTMTQRIILTMSLQDSLVADGLADTVTMTLSEVMVVNDIMQITRDDILQAADDTILTELDYHDDSVAAFTAARSKALGLVEDAAAPLVALQEMATEMWQVRNSMVEVTHRVADFSALCGVYPKAGFSTLFADWAYATEGSDGVGVDVSRHQFDHLMIQLEFTLAGPEGYTGRWNTDGWVLLRSANTERACTFGVKLGEETTLKAGVNRLSIPLSGEGYALLQSEENEAIATGVFDPTAVNRLQFYLAPEDYRVGEFSMTVTMARLVDVTRPGEAAVALDEVLAVEWDETAYTSDSWQAYAAAKTAATEARADYLYLSAEELNEAAVTLSDAADGLVEKPPYVLGDVDGKDGVTAADALLALQIATEQVAATIDMELPADVNESGKVEAGDALLILQVATKKIESFA